MSAPIVVLKIGGSILTGPQAYRRAAEFIASRLCRNPSERIVAVVSAEAGVTDALLSAARDIVEDPDPHAVDLLWSTGETRSAALLTLSLHARGVSARAVNVHEAGIVQPLEHGRPGHARLAPLRLLALLTDHDVVVAPGFLARGDGDALVSLGRGGSDLTAVMLAAGLQARSCELVKDVPGYFTSDPKRDPLARPVEFLSFGRAIEMAEAGCELVQQHALEAARDRGVPVLVSAIGHDRHTRIS